MDRRSFFASLGAVAATPLVGTQLAGCEGRDAAMPGGADPSEAVLDLRAYVIPDGVAAALPFHPLRKRPRP